MTSDFRRWEQDEKTSQDLFLKPSQTSLLHSMAHGVMETSVIKILESIQGTVIEVLRVAVTGTRRVIFAIQGIENHLSNGMPKRDVLEHVRLLICAWKMVSWVIRGLQSEGLGCFYRWGEKRVKRTFQHANLKEQPDWINGSLSKTKEILSTSPHQVRRPNFLIVEQKKKTF